MNVQQTRVLGQTEVSLAQMGLGTAPLGELWERIPEAHAESTFETAYSAGIRYFDTAPWYGNTLAEHRTGHFLRQVPRDEFVLSTKVGRVYQPESSEVDHPESKNPWTGGLPFVHKFDYTYDGLMRSYEDSLQRLGLNRIDLLVIHDLDYGYHGDEAGVQRRFEELDEGWRALDELRSSGEIKGIGAGINDRPMINRFLGRYSLDFLLVAMPYTLLDQSPIEDELNYCTDNDIGVIVGAPFASGILASGPRPDARYNYKQAGPEILEKTKRIQDVCNRYDVSLLAAALQFPPGHPAVASVIPGSVSPKEVQQNIEHFESDIPLDLWNELKNERLIHPESPVPA